MAKASQFASPGKLRSAQAVRREVAWLVSQAEIAVAKGQGSTAAFASIKAFLDSVSAYVATLNPVKALTAGTPTPASILANNTATSSVTFNLKVGGVNRAGVTVAFTKGGAQAATNTLSVASAVTDASGNAVVTLKGSAAGSGTIIATATVDGDVVTVTSSAITLT